MLAALVAASNARRLAGWAAARGLNSDDPALAPVTDDDWVFEELDPFTTTGTEPPVATTPN